MPAAASAAFQPPSRFDTVGRLGRPRRAALSAYSPELGVRPTCPLATDHITLTGRYRIALPEALRDHGAYRELNTTPALAA